MRTASLIIFSVQILLLAAFAVALRTGAIPLGVPGEWEWLRLPLQVSWTWLDCTFGIVAVLLYAVVCGAGFRALSARTTRMRETIALTTLWLSAILVQLSVQSAAPEGYGLSKWALALSNPGSSGYYTVAKKQIHDSRAFFANYSTWIQQQDSLHIGTHPPGLLLVQRGLLDFMESNPNVARWVQDHLPPSVDVSLRVIGPLPRADRATLAVTGFFTLLACASTVVPLYFLARAQFPAAIAWISAAAWPLVPSAILFQPAADTAFPFFSSAALAFTAFACRRGNWQGSLYAFLGGVVLGIGMIFTLAFLPIGLIVAIICCGSRDQPWTRRLLNLAMTGAGFLAITLVSWGLLRANPLITWWWNQRNHARFYVEYPRSYWSWLIVNPWEFAIALGIPISVWALVAIRRPRQVPLVCWATLAVLVFLTFSGKNLSEVARLWLPLMPPILLMMGNAFQQIGGGIKTLAASILLIGIETLLLQTTIQVVYPI